MREGGEEFAGAEEMGGIVRAVGAGVLEFGERFVEQMAAGSERAFDGRQERAVEIVEAQDQVEGGFGETDGFQVGFQQHNS